MSPRPSARDWRWSDAADGEAAQAGDATKRQLTFAANPLNPRFLEGGRLAQLVEHLVYTERVGGSSPSAPTMP